MDAPVTTHISNNSEVQYYLIHNVLCQWRDNCRQMTNICSVQFIISLMSVHRSDFRLKQTKETKTYNPSMEHKIIIHIKLSNTVIKSKY